MWGHRGRHKACTKLFQHTKCLVKSLTTQVDVVLPNPVEDDGSFMGTGCNIISVLDLTDLEAVVTKKNTVPCDVSRGQCMGFSHP